MTDVEPRHRLPRGVAEANLMEQIRLKLASQQNRANRRALAKLIPRAANLGLLDPKDPAAAFGKKT